MIRFVPYKTIEGIGRPGRPFSTHRSVFSTHVGSWSAYVLVFYVENDPQKVPETPKRVVWHVV